MVASGVAGLRLGSLDLVNTLEGASWQIQAVGEGTDFGNPQPLVTALESLLQDGDYAVLDRFGNRDIVIQIQIVASDSGGLAEGERALQAELGKANALTWTPPDGWGSDTVFRVWTSWLVGSFNDLDELRPSRRFAINLTCYPHALSASSVVTDAAPVVDPTDPDAFDDTVDNCSATTNWTKPPSASISAGSGALVATYAPWTGSLEDLYLERNELTLDVAAGEFIYVDFRTDVSGNGAMPVRPSLFINLDGSGHNLEYVAVATSPVNSPYRRAWFEVPASGTVLGLRVTIPMRYFGSITSMILDVVGHTNIAPIAGTPRQRLWSQSVQGSMRTMGSARIESETSGLGTVLFYTRRDDESGYTPSMRQYRTGGEEAVVDATTVSGAYEPLTTLVRTVIPVAQLPAGPYQLVARLRHSLASTRTLLWSTRLTNAAEDDLDTLVTGAGLVSFTAADTWQTFLIDSMILPTSATPEGSDLSVRFDLVAYPEETGTMLRDESWLFHKGLGRLTWVEAGAAQRLRIDSATTDVQVPRIYAGTAEDWSDAFYPGPAVRSWEDHEFAPEIVRAHLVTSGATDAALRLEHTPAWAHNAAIVQAS